MRRTRRKNLIEYYLLLIYGGEKFSYRNLLEMETIDKIHGKILASGIFQPLKLDKTGFLRPRFLINHLKCPSFCQQENRYYTVF